MADLPASDSMLLESIQVGLPRVMGEAAATDPMDREWYSGIFKEAVHSAVTAHLEGLAGDGQADWKNHGGPDKAINAYPIEHYDHWTTSLKQAFAAGAFGENFTTRGITEADISIGDIFRIGGILVQVSQPRQPCWKLARKWRIKDLAHQVQSTGRTGWYFRVLETGQVEAPAPMILKDRPYPEWTVQEANRIRYSKPNDPEEARRLSNCPALSASWQHLLAQRATSQG